MPVQQHHYGMEAMRRLTPNCGRGFRPDKITGSEPTEAYTDVRDRPKESPAVRRGSPVRLRTGRLTAESIEKPRRSGGLQEGAISRSTSLGALRSVGTLPAQKRRALISIKNGSQTFWGRKQPRDSVGSEPRGASLPTCHPLRG